MSAPVDPVPGTRQGPATPLERGRSQAGDFPRERPRAGRSCFLDPTMSTPVTITSDQRAVLYDEILVCLTGIGDLLITIGRNEFDKAQKHADEFADYLRVLADDLGWGKQEGGSIELQSPSDVLRRVMERLKCRAGADDQEISEQQAVIRERRERTALLMNTCDHLLAAVPTSP